MKKFSAIFLLCAFIWAQYARQVIYLECRVSNTFKAFAVKCDCEKKVNPGKPGSENSPLSKSHSHTHPDELFPVTRSSNPDFSIYSCPGINMPLENKDACEGSYNIPFQPPRA